MMGKWFHVVIKAGTALIGKVRVVDSGGTEITDSTEHSINVTGIGEVQDTPTEYTLLRRLKDIYTKLGAVVIAAGTAIIGKVGIDQTTPGVTNGVQVNAELPAGTKNIGDVDVASVVPGVSATNLGKAEDDVHASGDVGVMMLGVRKDTPAALAADGKYHPSEYDSSGRQHVAEKNSDDIKTAIGEVQATPTEYTLLRRLKDLLTAVNALQTGTETIQDIIDKIAGFQTGAETIQDIIDKIAGFQTGAETIQDVIDAIDDTVPTSVGQSPSGVNVTVASTEILAANADRTGAILVNDSDTVLYLAIGQTAVLNQGIRLNAHGGSLVLNKSGLFSTEAINGIHGGTGNKVCTKQEFE
jgi:hypothetical protein